MLSGVVKKKEKQQQQKMLPGEVKVHLDLLIGKKSADSLELSKASPKLTQEISTFGSKCPKTWSQIKIS